MVAVGPRWPPAGHRMRIPPEIFILWPCSYMPIHPGFHPESPTALLVHDFSIPATRGLRDPRMQSGCPFCAFICGIRFIMTKRKGTKNISFNLYDNNPTCSFGSSHQSRIQPRRAASAVSSGRSFLWMDSVTVFRLSSSDASGSAKTRADSSFGRDRYPATRLLAFPFV